MRPRIQSVVWPLAVIALVLILYALPGRERIAPRIQADNNYLYLAADRLHDGLGPTAIVPPAPNQPWEWRTDWALLTQWPLGYPLLLCGVRMLIGCGTVQAGQWIAIVSCAIALIGWFAWIRTVLPRGFASTLLATVAAGSASRLSLNNG